MVTKTVTTVTTNYVVVCPATQAGVQGPTGGKAQPAASIVTNWVTTYTTICPTPPPSCAPTSSLQKRDAGFNGPDFTLSGGDAGPTGDGDGPATVTESVTTTTDTVTSTTYSTTATVSQCSTLIAML